MLKLSILDQSQIGEGRNAAQTLAETTELAQDAERIGYHRFWVSEHHASQALAHSSPEVLIAHLAAKTERIRLGSGGIMMPHYSAYKVAENFRLLEALHPGRIDVGLGRAPGGMPISTRALQEGKYTSVDSYPQQIADLTGYLYDDLPAGHRFAGLHASPVISTAPEIWLLGSSYDSARIAADQGAAFGFAQFFGNADCEQALRIYREHFKPSRLNAKPYSLAAVLAICADTEEEANQLALSTDLFFLSLGKGKLLPWFPSVRTALDYPYTENDYAMIRSGRHRRIVGTPQQVKEEIMKLNEAYHADEIMVVSPIHNVESRLHSYRLLAKAFAL
ncbi:LLM class flavin-dependent oxidoreductase [Paenibacillus roseipurpureus]|uniref:LLM class flavin-dependent oxidoreductase n=1 Tax=Paenibacillus roseopurpureus TaxID=2918901 RepID=A0AA96RMC8_9BACL|nr:LLM class flavin-dependent oxidoreductase [Paenibacillus sp. MBLB1832]WNR46309.1 LLM class flavin-dependent oxidoreductase [Paenibacillus sp. MBLB1832]